MLPLCHGYCKTLQIAISPKARARNASFYFAAPVSSRWRRASSRSWSTGARRFTPWRSRSTSQSWWRPSKLSRLKTTSSSPPRPSRTSATFWKRLDLRRGNNCCQVENWNSSSGPKLGLRYAITFQNYLVLTFCISLKLEWAQSLART